MNGENPVRHKVSNGLQEKRHLLEDSTIEAWRNVWRRDGYGSGGGPTGVYHELELKSFQKFAADVATNYDSLRKRGRNVGLSSLRMRSKKFPREATFTLAS